MAAPYISTDEYVCPVRGEDRRASFKHYRYLGDASITSRFDFTIIVLPSSFIFRAAPGRGNHESHIWTLSTLSVSNFDQPHSGPFAEE